MTDADTAPDDPLFDALRAEGEMRAWSVIITIFGDSVRPRGGTVAASVLAEIAGRIGIGQPALRVALHRLARDGWLTRERRGRRSFYRLSPGGVAEFGPATRRIYAQGPALDGPWRLAACPPGLPGGTRETLEAGMETAGYVALAPGLYLGHGESGPPPSRAVEAVGELSPLPDWLRATLGPPDLAAAYARLEDRLAGLERLVDEDAPEGLDAVALRTLIVHHWRRLLLRHPDLPERFFPEGWRGEACRARVLSLHARLSPAADAWLETRFGAGTPAK